jgi:hypothetical protein
LINSNFRQSSNKKKFYEDGNQYITSLNVKLREKTVIKQEMNDKIACCTHELDNRRLKLIIRHIFIIIIQEFV